MIRHYSLNTTGRDFIVGDIHGCFSRLQSHLDHIEFDPVRDRLFSVGDLVDRGPENMQAVEWVAKPWFHAVCGNHDDMAIRWPNGNMPSDNYRANGGGWNIDQPTKDQARIAAAFKDLPIAIEVETAGGLVGIVHADCPYKDWDVFRLVLEGAHGKSEIQHASDMAQWSRERIKSGDRTPVVGVRAVVVGHTPLQRPEVLGNVYYIDTGAVFQGHDFTILDAATLKTVPLAGHTVDWAA